MSAVEERAAQMIAHRACCGVEHDPQNGKLHGYCVVCGVPWPCEYVGPKPSHAERLDALEAENERLRQLVSSAPAYERDARVEIERLRAELATARKVLQMWKTVIHTCLSNVMNSSSAREAAMAELTRAIEYAKLAAVAGKGYAARHCHNLEGDFSQIIMHLDSALRALVHRATLYADRVEIQLKRTGWHHWPEDPIRVPRTY